MKFLDRGISVESYPLYNVLLYIRPLISNPPPKPYVPETPVLLSTLVPSSSEPNPSHPQALVLLTLELSSARQLSSRLIIFILWLI